jgi:RimJ/RimL family protein N-acetyltransferase
VSSWLEGAPPDEIDAGALTLRRWRPEDSEVLARLVGDNLEHLRPWMAWARERPTLDDERAHLGHLRQAWERRTDFAYAVTLPSSEPIGSMGLHTRQGPGTLEIGYWIAAAHTGRGHATAAALALTHAAFALPGVERVEIRCDQANQASAAVPRKLGFALTEVIARAREAPAETGRRMIWAVGRATWRR